MSNVLSQLVATPPQHLRPDAARIATVALWPIAVMVVLHSVLVLAFNGSVTDDFTTVYSAIRRMLGGVPVYNENYATVDPHYLYNPGATLLLAPMGLSGDRELSRAVFIVLNAAAIIAALAVLVRLVGHRLTSWLFPGAVTVAFLTESVRNTLIFSNINGILLLALSGFLWLLLRGHRWWAGLVLGLAIVVKPMFAPLLLLPLMKFDWRTILGGVAVPVLANVIAWPLVPGAGDYLTRVVPYLGETRDYANSSLAGFAVYFDMPGWLEAVLWLTLGVFVAVGLAALFFYRDSAPLFWATTTTGLLLTGVFVMSSLGQQYYSMMLFPMILTVATRLSVFHVWPAWLAAFLFLWPGDWHSVHAPDAGRWASYFTATAGWSMLVVVIAVTAVVYLRRDRNILTSATVAAQEPVAANGNGETHV
ncbi:glycosyltransferase family 87 protein [Corynebacterium guangdongense]|uniref:Arabinofuranan 3-O-arabinosyltransferase n=1 Tax=Corynebacterium guangdongense TaxID=1783348 RepID=A0ABU2A005_9CORY|nr:glycosyltransferase family 87 protein [Corynebacterium guangdongense]MDR7329478.1 arabinofuranan 3-O-arabinosyltransferase [Corynebacterium guangdongense]WJZ18043.1 Alpha-(1->3)-arabinofuranosyltransferase [Corynebacterium guangdongense]